VEEGLSRDFTNYAALAEEPYDNRNHRNWKKGIQTSRIALVTVSQALCSVSELERQEIKLIAFK